MDYVIEIIGLVAAVIGVVSWIPQLAQAHKTRETKALNLKSLSMIFVCISLWFIYGVLIGAYAMIIGNSVLLMLLGYLIILKRRYG